MKKLVIKQSVKPTAPIKNWSIGVPKSFDRHPLGGFCNYLNEIAIIDLTRRSLSNSILGKSPEIDQK